VKEELFIDLKRKIKSHKFYFQCMSEINHQQLEFQQQILEIQVMSHAHNMPTSTLMWWKCKSECNLMPNSISTHIINYPIIFNFDI
jgi:hypothetical protein